MLRLNCTNWSFQSFSLALEIILKIHFNVNNTLNSPTVFEKGFKYSVITACHLRVLTYFVNFGLKSFFSLSLVKNATNHQAKDNFPAPDHLIF